MSSYILLLENMILGFSKTLSQPRNSFHENYPNLWEFYQLFIKLRATCKLPLTEFKLHIYYLYN